MVKKLFQYQERALYEMLFRKAKNAIILFDSSDNIVDVNESACELYGYSRDEFLNLGLCHLKPPGIFPALDTGMLSAGTMLQNNSFETEDVKKDGSVFLVEGTVSALEIEGEKFFFAILRDITGRREIEEELRKTSSFTRSIVESPTMVRIWAIDPKYRYTFFNKAHRVEMKKVWNADIEIGRCILDYLNDATYREIAVKYYKTIFEGRSFSEIDDVITIKERPMYFRTIGTPILEKDGNVAGATFFATEITDRVILEKKLKQSLADKDILLKEVHHRVKNNLQIISSILNMQMMMSLNEEVRSVLAESKTRIGTMALIHEKLYQSENLVKIDLSEYVQSLAYYIAESYKSRNRKIQIHFQLCGAAMPIDTAIPIGLIVNELMSNIFKYAFKGRDTGNIRIICETGGDSRLKLSIADDGVGFNSDVNTESPTTLGLKMVRALSEQLNGTFSITSHNGVRAVLDI